MPRAKATSKQQLVTELRRTEILGAARKVFGNKGFDGTHMQEIAIAAGLAKGTLYLYFSSKDEIYQAVVQQAIVEALEITHREADGEPTFLGKYAAFIRVRIAYWQEHHTLYRLILSMARAPDYRKKGIAWQKQSVVYLADILRQGAEAGEFPATDYMAAAWTTMDAIRGLNERRVFAESACSSVEQDTAFLTSFLLKAVLGR